MKAAGAVKTYAFGPVRETGWHLMGTTKMGDDRRDSVVNRHGQLHDVPNLYIADSSVFVTSGAVNPTSTLQAVALWISDAVARNLGVKLP
jgi:choline dehydrogenase-like flavoprotein